MLNQQFSMTGEEFAHKPRNHWIKSLKFEMEKTSDANDYCIGPPEPNFVSVRRIKEALKVK